MKERIDWNAIETKWQEKWAREHTFETNPDDRPKKFITVAYPYPNSPQHIGHGRTYTLTDVHARFYRMLGYNVLFPMAFHYTGTPILGMAKRVEAGDEDLMGNLRNLYGVPEENIKEFAEPVKIADYFHEEIKAGMIEMGYSIDWRREFTTIDPAYSKFIEWQIKTLRNKNLIIQGSHPVGWCPKDQNPVSQHDTLGDVEPDFTEYVMIKFRFEKYLIPTATLRPETLFGITNLWVDPDVVYKKISITGGSASDSSKGGKTWTEKWIVSKECAYKLEFLDRKITYEGEIKGSDLVGKTVITPHDERLIPILPAGFVQGGTGTGIVMSVPAHAPYDYQALEDLKTSSGSVSERAYYNDKEGACVADGHATTPSVASTARGIKPIPIIETEGYGEIPAMQAVEKFKIRDQHDPKLEEATKEIYAKEYYGGKLGENTARFSGTMVSDAKDAVRDWLTCDGHAEILLELTNAPVRCRCGAECVVKVLNNQWFLNYADSSWKESATKCMEGMNILPREIRTEFSYVVGWLRERACARQHGLGTRLPWDKDWIVESLSDSVIYMAYYIISKFVNDGTIAAKDLSVEFFDYVFLGTGSASKVSKVMGLPQEIIGKIRDEFVYFYPVDSRHSGRDLVPNHLTFFVLNHTAIFPETMWPREIVVNGSVLMNGAKMSKSMGNIIPLRKAIMDYGADPIRLAIIISAELLQDADFNMESISGIQARLELLHGQCSELGAFVTSATTLPESPNHAEDRWILSRERIMVSQVTNAMNKMRLREALHGILFSFESDLAWYQKRARAKDRWGEIGDYANMSTNDNSRGDSIGDDDDDDDDNNDGSSAKRDDSIVGILHKIISTRVAMLSPFAPHIAEEMWAKLGNSGLASVSGWPESSHDEIDPTTIQSEELLRSIMQDITSILKVTKISPSRITIYTAEPLKSRVYRGILGKVMGGCTGMGEIMKALIADPDTEKIKKNPDFVQRTLKDILSTPVDIRQARNHDYNGGTPEGFNERFFLTSELTGLIRAEYGVNVDIFCESDSDIHDPKNKARHARPFKPAILVE